MYLMKKIFAAFGLFLIGAVSYAQSSVSLKLADEQTGEPVGFATVSLTAKGESKPVKYVLTSSEGDAVITKVKKNTYILKAEMMGYKMYQQTVVVEKDVNLGTLKMQPDQEVLDAASVSAG